MSAGRWFVRFLGRWGFHRLCIIRRRHLIVSICFLRRWLMLFSLQWCTVLCFVFRCQQGNSRNYIFLRRTESMAATVSFVLTSFPFSRNRWRLLWSVPSALLDFGMSLAANVQLYQMANHLGSLVSIPSPPTARIGQMNLNPACVRCLFRHLFILTQIMEKRRLEKRRDAQRREKIPRKER